MRLIREIYCKPNLPHDGRIFHREAVRGIIRHADKFLLVHSPVDGDYKFPGGGVKPGERLHTALLRELREECGVDLTEISGDYGKTIEYDLPQEEKYDLFCMVSYYYFCRINPEMPFHAQHLDRYEKELCIKPVWMDLEDALVMNRAVASSSSKIPPRWVQREIVVMEDLLKSAVNPLS